MTITAVAGCPRSGTSMMMTMLAAGGIEPYCDAAAYGASYEAHEVNGLPGDHAWLERCAGKAVKLLDPHHYTPPPTYRYRVIFMTRDVHEQAKSLQRFVLAMAGIRLGVAALPKLRASLRQDTAAALEVMRRLDPGLLVLRFEDVLADPAGVAKSVAWHAGGNLDTGAMARVVRERGPQALRRPAELDLVRGAR